MTQISVVLFPGKRLMAHQAHGPPQPLQLPFFRYRSIWTAPFSYPRFCSFQCPSLGMSSLCPISKPSPSFKTQSEIQPFYDSPPPSSSFIITVLKTWQYSDLSVCTCSISPSSVGYPHVPLAV